MGVLALPGLSHRHSGHFRGCGYRLPPTPPSLPRPQLNIQSHPSPAGAHCISLANGPGGSPGNRARAGPPPVPRPRALPRAAPLGSLGPRAEPRAAPAGPAPAGSVRPGPANSLPAGSRSVSDIPPHPQAPIAPLHPTHLAAALGLHSFPGILLIARHPCSPQHPGDPTACHDIPGLPEHPWDPRACYGGSYLQVSSHSCDCCTEASCQ